MGIAAPVKVVGVLVAVALAVLFTEAAVETVLMALVVALDDATGAAFEGVTPAGTTVVDIGISVVLWDAGQLVTVGAHEVIVKTLVE